MNTDHATTESNVAMEVLFQSETSYTNPFIDVTLDVEFGEPDGERKLVPAFWAGGNEWRVRYASPKAGTHTYNTICSNKDDKGKKLFPVHSITSGC